MAIALALRLAVVTTAAALRAASSGQPQRLPAFLERVLSDSEASDEELSLRLSDATGSMWSVATFLAPLELRRAQLVYTRASGSGTTPEDVAVNTFDFVKLASGAPTGAWTSADFEALETLLQAWWGTVNDDMTSLISLDEIRWYALGPAIEAENGGPGRTGPPRRVLDVSMPGAQGVNNQLPPQVAVSITEQTSSRQHWGRIYLPSPSASVLGPGGRLGVTFLTALADACNALYDGAAAAGLPAVVYSMAKPERPTAGGGTLPAWTARVYTVDQIQIDDLADVIRGRRYDKPLLRVQRAVGT